MKKKSRQMQRLHQAALETPCSFNTIEKFAVANTLQNASLLKYN
jgi:hypothetical protein